MYNLRCVVDDSEELVCLSDDLVLMHKLAASCRANQVIAAILASAALAADGRYHIEIGVELDGIAWQLIYLANVIHAGGCLYLRHDAPCMGFARRRLALRRIGKDHHLAPIEFVAVNPIHYHSVALP